MSDESPRKPWHLLGRAKLPITSTLLVAFGGLVAIAVATVLVISLSTARGNTLELQEETAQQRLVAAIDRIERYLTPAEDDVIFLADQLSSGDVPLRDDQQINMMMRGSLGSAPQIDGLAFVRADYTGVRMKRDPERDKIDSVAG